VFAANGLAGARTSTIADAAGVAESMIYRHFASKQELFDVAVVQPLAQFVEGVVDCADRLLDRDGLRELDAENKTMRSIVADQSIQLHRLRDRLDSSRPNANG
jgi:AcrR family transcriptional regulator